MKTSIPSTPTLGLNPLLIVLLMFAGASRLVASTTHDYTGWENDGSYWSLSFNWLDSSVPNGNGTETLRFLGQATRRVCTNDLLQTPPHSVYAMDMRAGGFDLRGDPLSVFLIYAGYPAGTNCTLRFDLLNQVTATIYTNNSTLNLAGDISLTTGPLALLGAGDCVVSGVISGSYGVSKQAGNYGDLSLAGVGANTYTGTTIVNDGILRLNRYRMLGDFVLNAVAVPGDLTIGTGNSGVASDLVVLNRSSQIADTSAVTVNGSGQLDLNDWSDTIESLTVRGGSVVTGTGTLTVISNVTANLAAAPAILAGNLHFKTNNFQNTHWLLVDDGTELEIPANISADADTTVEKWWGGDLWLMGSNACAFYLGAGTLTLVNAHALGGDALRIHNGLVHLYSVTISNATMLPEDGLPTQLQGTGTCGWWGDIDLTRSGDLIVNAVSGATLTLGGKIIGTSDGFSKVGPGTAVLAGGSTNEFPWVSVQDGILRLLRPAHQNALTKLLTIGSTPGSMDATVELAASEQIANAGLVQVNATGVFDVNGKTETVGQLTGVGAVDLGAGAMVVSNVNAHTFAGNFRGGRAGFSGAEVTKSGPGTWTLSGSNSHFGRTYVAAGRLLVNGTIVNSAIEISGGATVGGTGTIQSVSFTASGGTLAPGNSTGRLFAQGPVNFAHGSLEVELSGLAPGSGYDQLVAEVAPSLNSGSLSVLPGFTPPVGSTFIIISNRSAAAVSGTFSGKAQGTKFAAGGMLFLVSYTGGNGNDVVLTRVAAPGVSNFAASAVGGPMQLQAQGIADLSYVLEAAPHLNAPIPWQPIKTNSANGVGVVQFIDSELPLHAQRFYRVASP